MKKLLVNNNVTNHILMNCFINKLQKLIKTYLSELIFKNFGIYVEKYVFNLII